VRLHLILLLLSTFLPNHTRRCRFVAMFPQFLIHVILQTTFVSSVGGWFSFLARIGSCLSEMPNCDTSAAEQRHYSENQHQHRQQKTHKISTASKSAQSQS
jgi:hypothetical protein